MRTRMTIVGAAVAVWCSLGLAAAPKADPPPDNQAPARVQDVGNAQLRTELHRTMAALIEARTAEKPDPGKIEELTAKLQQLRGKLRGDSPQAVAGARCPYGGPGMGYGRGPGRGYGYGWGGGGRGPGGYGPGAGRGWGGGAGRGFGPGAGQGLAPGGPAFVDADRDGVCDHYQQRRGR